MSEIKMARTKSGRGTGIETDFFKTEFSTLTGMTADAGQEGRGAQAAHLGGGGENRPLGLDGGTQSCSRTRGEATRDSAGARSRGLGKCPLCTDHGSCAGVRGRENERKWNRERPENRQAAPARCGLEVQVRRK